MGALLDDPVEDEKEMVVPMRSYLSSLSLVLMFVALPFFASCESDEGNGAGGACSGASCNSADAAADVAVEAADTPPAADVALEAGTDLAAPEVIAEVVPGEVAVETHEVAVEVDAVEEVAVSNSIQIPIADLGAIALFFSYEGTKAVIKYFAVLDVDGAPHVAFDACDVCYGAKQGYSQDGDEMVCNNCGNRFKIKGLGLENRQGGCWPGYLQAEITDTHIVIEPETLEAGSWYFE